MRTKRLRSVMQSIGHHGLSGLCYVHPHLGDACRKASISVAEVDLLTGEILTQSIDCSEPAVLGSEALGQRFAEILAAEGMEHHELISASIRFQFERGRWPSGCYVRAETMTGTVVEDALNNDGYRKDIRRDGT